MQKTINRTHRIVFRWNSFNSCTDKIHIYSPNHNYYITKVEFFFRQRLDINSFIEMRYFKIQRVYAPDVNDSWIFKNFLLPLNKNQESRALFVHKFSCANKYSFFFIYVRTFVHEIKLKKKNVNRWWRWWEKLKSQMCHCSYKS
jgi:hypothetical protein